MEELAEKVARGVQRGLNNTEAIEIAKQTMVDCGYKLTEVGKSVFLAEVSDELDNSDIDVETKSAMLSAISMVPTEE